MTERDRDTESEGVERVVHGYAGAHEEGDSDVDLEELGVPGTEDEWL